MEVTRSSFMACKIGCSGKNVDALIVAGDLSDTFGPSLQDALAYLTRYVSADRIYVVPGNHDYYSGRLDDENRLRDLVHASGSWFAQKTELRHRSDRYLCATLWTDFDLLGASKCPVMNCLARTRCCRAALSRSHRRTQSLCIGNTAIGWKTYWAPHFAGNGRTFVITHHGPHPSAGGPVDGLTPAFHSDLTEVLERSDIDTWFFGHSHRRLSSTVAGTHIQNVSIGYPEEDHGDDEDDLAEVCFVAAALDTQCSNELRDLPADQQALEQDFEYARWCSETGVPVLVDKLAPSTRAYLRHALRGCACPVVPEGDAYYATDVIALGRAAKPTPQDVNRGDQ